MRFTKIFAALATVTLAISLTPSTASATSASDLLPIDWTGPNSWTNRQLAAQTIFTCSSEGSLHGQANNVRSGLGGIALVGTGASPNLKKQILKLRKLSPNGVGLVVASDEEGGWVQRLRHAIYDLPSASTMGAWSDSKITRTAYAYGKKMKALGVDIAFSPVADLNVPGFFIDENRRGFSSKPAVAAKKAVAWATGLINAGVIPTVKHWPGHGGAVDTHARPSTIAPLATLKQRDLLPFTYAFSHGVKMAMVGHLLVPGLTEPKTPTSRSPKALELLRSQLGPDGIIITDSLSMGGATRGMHKDIAEVAIRSLEAGVDIALVCTGPKNLISRVTAAIDSGRLSRSSMIANVRRILELKRQLGLTK